MIACHGNEEQFKRIVEKFFDLSSRTKGVMYDYIIRDTNIYEPWKKHQGERGRILENFIRLKVGQMNLQPCSINCLIGIISDGWRIKYTQSNAEVLWGEELHASHIATVTALKALKVKVINEEIAFTEEQLKVLRRELMNIMEKMLSMLSEEFHAPRDKMVWDLRGHEKKL